MVSVLTQEVMQVLMVIQIQQSGLSLPLGIDIVTGMTVHPRIPSAASGEVGFSVLVNAISL